MSLRWLSVLALVLALAVACGGGGGSRQEGTPSPNAGAPSPGHTTPVTGSSPAPVTQAELPVKIVVTMPFVADMAREVGGDNVEVYSIVPLGADPHTYKPTPADVQRIAAADLIFVNGLGLESKAVLDAIDESRREGARLVPFAPNVRSPRASELGDPEITAEEANDNPHLWQDPTTGRIYADIIADILVILDGVNTGYYYGLSLDYRNRISELDVDIRAQMESIPVPDRKLVTFHDAFVHFARRYNLDVVGSVAMSSGDAGGQSIADLTDAVREEEVRAVFAEVGFDDDALREIGRDAGVPVCTLYSDIQDENAPTFIEMMRANAAEIVRCLGGG